MGYICSFLEPENQSTRTRSLKKNGNERRHAMAICNACNAQFPDEQTRRSHYRSEWHQYNLRRKVAGVPGITEALFNLRLETLAAEKRKSEEEPLLFICTACNKEYRNRQAHAQHLSSKLHLQKVLNLSKDSSQPITVMRSAPSRNEESEQHDWQSESSSDEWEEVNHDEIMSLDSFGVNGYNGNEPDRDVNQCFFCNIVPDGSMEGCVEHMHKQHGFFIPDADYLNDPQGLLTYLGLKVTKDFTCLYCANGGKHFQSLEAVQKHMISKSHCKIRYGDEDQDEELDVFYHYESSYLPLEDIVSVEEPGSALLSLSAGGAELVIKRSSEKAHQVKAVGCREFLRYYKQKPRPSYLNHGVLGNTLASRYKSMGLSTTERGNRIRSYRGTRNVPHVQAELMKSKVAIKNNKLNKLPNNVPY